MKIKRIDYSKRFIKSLKRAPKKIQIAFRNRLEVFLSESFHPILNNHSLSGEYQGYRNINITGDWRAIFKKYASGGTVYFVAIGTHSSLYK